MFDVALKSAGGQVVIATSSDDNHPPENIIDGNTETFWTSTGMFPQEFVITFSSVMRMTRIELSTFNVKNIVIEKSCDPDPNNFEYIMDKELDSTDGRLQQEEFTVNGNEALHLRVVIKSGYDHFVSVHKLTVEGNAIHG